MRNVTTLLTVQAFTEGIWPVKNAERGYRRMEAVMLRARAFLFVSAGLLLLALTYHLGARSAGAQGGGTAEVAAFEYAATAGNTYAAAVSGRTVYSWEFTGGNTHWIATRPGVPGTEPIVAVKGTGDAVMLANGDVYTPGGGGWVRQINVFDGPTPAQRESFGAVKSRYRGERGPAQPQDR